jgi:hypothetical protein
MPRPTAFYRVASATFAISAFSVAGVLAWVACALCGAASKAVAAEPVWRCQSAAGHAVAYQSTPCQDGGQALPTTQPPSPTNHADSVRVAEREARLARAMGRQRAHQEKLARDLPPAHTSLSGPVRQVSVGQREEAQIKARRRTRHRVGEASPGTRQRRRDVFRAEVPGQPRKRAERGQADDAISASASPSR